MFATTIVLLLAGTLVLLWNGYREGVYASPELGGVPPMELARLRRHLLFYRSCMLLAFLGMALVMAAIGVFRVALADEGMLPAALGASAAFCVLSLAMWAWRWICLRE